MRWLILLIFISGCARYDIVRDTNRKNLLKLEIGMSKQAVLDTMGTEDVVIGANVDRISNPYRSEIIRDSSKTYEVLYYYTDIKKADGAITDDELTPLVLYKNKLIGWGWRFVENVGTIEIRER